VQEGDGKVEQTEPTLETGDKGEITPDEIVEIVEKENDDDGAID